MKRHKRLGVTAIETALALPILFAMFVATFDLGLLAFRQHAIDHTASYAARLASLHGEGATVTGAWGPATIDEPATATGYPIIDQTSDYLSCCDSGSSRYLVEWPSGSNSLDEEVRVTITTVHQHLLPLLGADKSLRAECTVRIEH